MGGGIGGGTFVVEQRIVEGWLADRVLLGSPVAQVVQLASFAAERKLRVGRRICGLFANGAAVFHRIQNTAKLNFGSNFVTAEGLEL